jgi:RimJ/RimL family protein N-acetyltransferase
MTDHAFPAVTLPTRRLRLRPFAAGDAADVHAIWHDQVYLEFAPAQFAHTEASLDQAVQWCAHQAEEQRAAGQGVAFAGEDRDTGRLACHVSLFGVRWDAMIAEIHYWTAPWARGRGYAAEAATAVAHWALAEQGFARITLNAVTANSASLKVARAAGFTYEGTMRNAAWSRAGRGDMSVWSLIPADLSDQAAG